MLKFRSNIKTTFWGVSYHVPTICTFYSEFLFPTMAMSWRILCACSSHSTLKHIYSDIWLEVVRFIICLFYSNWVSMSHRAVATNLSRVLLVFQLWFAFVILFSPPWFKSGDLCHVLTKFQLCCFNLMKFQIFLVSHHNS